MRHCAFRTQVAPEATLGQIKRLLRNAGAQAIATVEEEERAAIGFRLHGRLIRMTVDYPDKNGHLTTAAKAAWLAIPTAMASSAG